MQFRLTEDQVEALRRRARAEGRCVADLVHESVSRFAVSGTRPRREELVRRAREVQGRFRSGVPDLAGEHDRHLAEAFDR